MYHQALPHNRKHFCCYCLQNFSRAEMLKNIVMTVLKLMANKWLECLRKVKLINLKIMRKKESSLMIDTDFERILAPENNGKQNTDVSFATKYQNCIPYSYGYKSLCVDDKFNKPFKSYIVQDVVYNY